MKHNKTRYACKALMVDSRERHAPHPLLCEDSQKKVFMNWKWDPTRLQICVHLHLTLAVLHKDYEK